MPAAFHLRLFWMPAGRFAFGGRFLNSTSFSVKTITYRYLFMHPSGTELAQLAELIEQVKLKVIVDKAYFFSNVAEDLAYVESGRAKGKVVVSMD
jgi:NADPH:quinone reductase-like Zn-dependent oxidoreductase